VNRLIILLAMLALLASAQSCASTSMGRGMDPEKTASLVSMIEGKSKEAVIKTLGDPDFVTTESDAEYWGYQKRNAWNLNLYYGSAGKTSALDLVVKWAGNRAIDPFIIAKGSSLGIISSPLSVPN
jgi:hypothetical protein